jgi:hypothetical protein
MNIYQINFLHLWEMIEMTGIENESLFHIKCREIWTRVMGPWLWRLFVRHARALTARIEQKPMHVFSGLFSLYQQHATFPAVAAAAMLLRLICFDRWNGWSTNRQQAVREEGRKPAIEEVVAIIDLGGRTKKGNAAIGIICIYDREQIPYKC